MQERSGNDIGLFRWGKIRVEKFTSEYLPILNNFTVPI